MLLIPCPWCGAREQSEFSYGGDASGSRPRPDAPGDSGWSEAWHEYVYLRSNPRGRHVEYWQHSSGCRRWFRLVRDTLTHEIAAGGVGDPRPGEGRQ